MKATRKTLSILLALLVLISAFTLVVFAGAFDAIETPIIPVPGGTQVTYKYVYNEFDKTAVLSQFTPNLTTPVIEQTTNKDGEEYRVVGIGDEVFMNTSIKSVVIPDGVTFIGKSAFKNCASLATVSIADSVIQIEEDAFEGTKWLQDQPEGLVMAGKVLYRFTQASFDFLALPSETVSIAAGAFRGIQHEFEVVIPEDVEVYPNAFAECPNVLIYCVEDSSAHAYAEANGVPFVFVPYVTLVGEAKNTYYQGDALDLGDLTVRLIDVSGSQYVPVSSAMVSGYDPQKLGEQTLSVSYGGEVLSFTVTVSERPPYIVGDTDGNGILDPDDAIYLLFHVMFPERYLVSQSVDFDKSGDVDSDDAIYLLFHTMFPERYPIS